MTVEQALARARELRPGCKISDETCRRWLCEEDALLRQQLFEKSRADEYAAAGADLAWSGEALADAGAVCGECAVFHGCFGACG